MQAPSPTLDPNLQPTNAAEQAETQAKQDVMQSGMQNIQTGTIPQGQAPAQGPAMQQPQITPPPGAGIPAPPPR